MNRRTLLGWLVAAPAAALAALRAKAFGFSDNPARVIDQLLTGAGFVTDKSEVGRLAACCDESVTPKNVAYRSGMRLRFTGRPPEHGRWAAHSASLAPGCIVDADTGERVTNIESLVLSVSSNAWMDAVVTTVDRDASAVTRRLVRRRGRSPISLDLVVRSESAADHAERVKRMEAAVHAADMMADHVEIDEWGAVTDYRRARKRLDELGGIA